MLASPHLQGCLGLKPVVQTQDHTCGAASAATVLRWFGLVASEDLCAQSMGTNSVVGVDWWDMTRYLRHRGLKAQAWARFSTEALRGQARRGLPTLVALPGRAGHWVVCVGVEPALHAFVFADPSHSAGHFVCFQESVLRDAWSSDRPEVPAFIPGLAVTVERWPRDRLRPEKAYTKRRTHHLIDWPTHRSWVEVYRRVRAQPSLSPSRSSAPQALRPAPVGTS